MSQTIVCPDHPLSDLTSQNVMEVNGWIINATNTFGTARYDRSCGTDTWFGFTFNKPVGAISTTLKGTGTATLRFGDCCNDCGGDQLVKVYLNGRLLAETNKKSKSVGIVTVCC